MNPTGIQQLIGSADISDHRRFHHITQAADNSNPPRTAPDATHTNIILIGYHTEILTLIIQTGSTLTTLDISLREQYKDIICRRDQRRIAPTVVISLSRLEDTTETGNRLHLISSGKREETLVGFRPLLHPALRSFRDEIGGLLLG